MGRLPSVALEMICEALGEQCDIWSLKIKVGGAHLLPPTPPPPRPASSISFLFGDTE